MFLPLLTGLALLLASLLAYAAAMNLLVRVVARMIRAGYTGPGFWKNFSVVALVLLTTAAAHLIQIALWSAAFVLLGVMPNFERAFYFSAQSYTSLGYGDVVLPERWQLLGPLEAINGLLFFGLSTALLFAIVGHLIGHRLRAEIGHRDHPVRGADVAPGPAREDFLSPGRSSAADDLS